MTAFALKATMIIAMTYMTTILQWQTADMTVGLSAKKEAEELLSLSDTLGMGMSQRTALWVCIDAGVNKPTFTASDIWVHPVQLCATRNTWQQTTRLLDCAFL